MAADTEAPSGQSAGLRRRDATIEIIQHGPVNALTGSGSFGARLREIRSPMIREVAGLGLPRLELSQRSPRAPEAPGEGVLALPAGGTVLRLLLHWSSES
jgi:hypothetical protein